MTPEMEALGRRVVACKAWRWMPGMLAGGFRVCRVDAHGYRYGWSDSSYAYRISEDVVPDLTDPATLGCLLALVREHLEDKGVGAICQDVGIMNGGVMWSLIGEGGEFAGYWTKKAYYTTEAEALAEALEVER